MITLEEFKTLPVSEKLLLAHIEPSERIFQWTSHSGSIYKVTTEYFVINVTEADQNNTNINNVTSLTKATSSSLSSGEWYFDSSDKTLYIRLSDDSDPNDININEGTGKYINVIYRLFYSNIPIDLPYNLQYEDDQKIVPYEGLIKNTSAFTDQMDDERKGTAIESTGTISFYNNDGSFDDTFDKLTWESKRVSIWIAHRSFDFLSSSNPPKIQLFEGIIANKSFNRNSISFEVTDFNYKLREPVDIPRYTPDDFTNGDVNNSLLPNGEDEGVYKRRVYGKVEGLEIPSANKVEDQGVLLSGTFRTKRDDVGITITETQAGDGSSTNEIQLIEFDLVSIPGQDDPTVPEGGTWRLEYNGSFTKQLPYNILASQLETQLEGVTGVGNVSVVGDMEVGFTVSWNDFNNRDLLQVNNNSLYTNDIEKIIGISGTNVHKEVSPGDEIIALKTGDIRSEVVSTTVETLSRVDINANTEMEVDFTATGQLQLDGTSAGINTINVSAGDWVVIKGVNVEPNNRGVWKVDSIPANGIIDLVRTSGNVGTTQTNVTINTEDDNFDIVVISNNQPEQINLSSEFSVEDAPFNNKQIYIYPNTPSTKKNRKFFITHHECWELSKTIDSVNSTNRVIGLSDTSDLYQGDILLLDDQYEVEVVSIGTGTITVQATNQSDDINTILNNVSGSDSLKRLPVQEVRYSNLQQDEVYSNKLKHSRDYTQTNSSSNGLSIEISENAEVDATPRETLTTSIEWTNGSPVIYSESGRLSQYKRNESLLGSRVWLKPEDDSVWYEAEEVVHEGLIILREPYSGVDGIKTTQVKRVRYITDNSIVSCTTYGKSPITTYSTPGGDSSTDSFQVSDGATPVSVVVDMLGEAGLLWNGQSKNFNEDDFTAAAISSNYLVSLALPLRPRQQSAPTKRDVITLMNDTVFGSLFQGNNTTTDSIRKSLSYKILGANSTNVIEDDLNLTLTDSDVLEWNIRVNSDKIVSKVDGFYRHKDIDYLTLEQQVNFVTTQYNNNVINSNVTNQKLDVNLYLYFSLDANAIAQRYAWINNTSQNIITIETKLNTVDLSLNDLVFLQFDRLFNRTGGVVDNSRLGLINSITRSEQGCVLEVDDLGSLFHRSQGLSSDSTTSTFANATNLEKKLYYYLTDDDGLISSDENTKIGNEIF